MEVEIFNRFKGASWFERMTKEQVLIGGAGGIGSWLALLLTRCGTSVYIYDFDKVELHNIGGQLYSKSDVGLYKVDALNKIIRSLVTDSTYIEGDTNKYDEKSLVSDLCVAAFDNMAARKIMFDKWSTIYKDNNEALFIDGRLTASEMKIFCVTPDRIERYKETLFDDSEVEDAPCTFKQTSFGAAMIASHIVGFITNHISNISQGVDKSIGSALPFYWEYNIPIDLLRTND
jgi:molybdopterin/thiamine biosynthesis adenylyltransferase